MTSFMSCITFVHLFFWPFYLSWSVSWKVLWSRKDWQQWLCWPGCFQRRIALWRGITPRFGELFWEGCTFLSPFFNFIPKEFIWRIMKLISGLTTFPSTSELNASSIQCTFYWITPSCERTWLRLWNFDFMMLRKTFDLKLSWRLCLLPRRTVKLSAQAKIYWNL